MTRDFHQVTYRPPAGAADILLVRHGQSEPARPGCSFPLVDGHGDPALHPNGHAQAEAVAARLANQPIAAIYVTPLQRTGQTAAPLAKTLGLSPVVERELREVYLGDWEGGLYRIKAAENDPLWLEARDRQEWGVIPGAETSARLRERVRGGLKRIAARHPDRLVVVFVHGGVIGAALSAATGALPLAFAGANNGSISRIVVCGDDMSVRAFNDCAHLG